MKIGILTVHRAINIGAILQTYATQEILRSLGYDAYVIDYVQEKVERVDREKYDWRKWVKFVLGGHLRGALQFCMVKNNVARQRKLFDNFLAKKLRLTAPCSRDNIPQDFDAYVVGSDQLWNSNIFEGRNEDVFWGNFQRKAGTKLMAYACSTTQENLASTNPQYIQHSLLNFDFVSLREGDSTQYINQYFKLGKPAEWVLDPTLAVDSKVWKNMCMGKFANEKYVLYYAARTYTPAPKLMREKTEVLAKQMGCKVKTLNMETSSDYVDLISHAQCVVSSSFHGIVFTLIFNRPLLAVKYGDNQDKRYTNLLYQLGGEKMLVDINEDFKFIEPDYDSINKNLKAWREKSIAFISQLNMKKEL